MQPATKPATTPTKLPNVFDSTSLPPLPEPARSRQPGKPRSQAYVKGRRIWVRCPHCREERKISECTWVRSGYQPVNAWPCGSCRNEIAKNASLRQKAIIPGHNGCMPVRHKEIGIMRVNCRGSRVNLSLEGGHECPAYEACQYYAACLDWKSFVSNGIDFRSGKRIYLEGQHGKLVLDVSPGLLDFCR